MADDLFILRDGACVYSTTVKGTGQVDVSFLSGFASSVTTFARYISHLGSSGADSDGQASETSTVSIDGHTFVLQTAESFTLVLHAAAPLAAAVMRVQIRGVRELLEVLFGAPHAWLHHFEVSSVDDVLRAALARFGRSLAALVPGAEGVPLSENVSAELDKELSTLQQHPHVYSAGLFLDTAVLHSRLPTAATRAVQVLLRTRPLGRLRLRATPVCVGDWRQLVLLSMGPYVLAALCSLQIPSGDLLAGPLMGFEESFLDSQLSLPVEVPPLHLHQVAPPGVVAFVLYHLASGVTVAPDTPPEMHDSPESTAHAAFVALFEVAADAATAPAVDSVCVKQDQFRFYASTRAEYRIFALLHDDIDEAEVEGVVGVLAGAAMGLVGGATS